MEKTIEARLKVVEIKGKHFIGEAVFSARKIEVPDGTKFVPCSITYTV